MNRKSGISQGKLRERNGYWALAIFSLVAMTSLYAMASDGEGGGDAGPVSPAESATEVSFERFREQCADPSKSEVQRAPQDIRVVCRNQEQTWIAGVPGRIPLKSERRVGITVVSDKFKVAETSSEVEAVQSSGACQRYQEVIEDFSIEVPVSCAEILDMKIGFSELCRARIDESRGKNESAVQVRATGREVDTCAGIPVQAE